MTSGPLSLVCFAFLFLLHKLTTTCILFFKFSFFLCPLLSVPVILYTHCHLTTLDDPRVLISCLFRFLCFFSANSQPHHKLGLASFLSIRILFFRLLFFFISLFLSFFFWLFFFFLSLFLFFSIIIFLSFSFSFFFLPLSSFTLTAT